jgi:hypothetical protein
MNQVLEVSVASHWDLLRDRKLLSVVDPMVLRTADLFFAGAPADRDTRDKVWAAIDANLAALMTFVDVVVTHDELPVFSYETTFREARLLDLEPLSEILWPVAVTGQVYEQTTRSAIAEIDRWARAASGAPATAGVGLWSQLDADAGDLLGSIVGELAAFDYDWNPPGVPEHLCTRDRRFYTFLLGLLVFDGFAQQLSIEGGAPKEQARRIVQPKRSRLFAEVVLRSRSPVADPEDPQDPEETVFSALAERLTADSVAGITRVRRFERAPTFLPLLLSQDRVHTPRHLLDALVKLRADGSVSDYKGWLDQLREALVRGRVPPTLERDLNALAARVARATSGAPRVPLGLEISVTGPAVTVPTGGSALIGFTKQWLPGGRHHKLMYRAVRAQARYWDLTPQLKAIWESP